MKCNDFVSLEQVQDWVGDLDETEAADLINKFVEVNKPKEQGEVETQVANP
jgi:hypothetical protein